MKISKIISTSIEKGKQIIKILGYGAKDVQTVFNVQPFGIDSRPVAKYRGIYADTASKEEKILIGVIFENAEALEGETRLHSEDSDQQEMASVYLKANGDIELTRNASSTIILKENGDIEINGNGDNMVRFSDLKSGFDTLKEDFNNFITTFNSHVHAGVTPGGGSTAITPTPGSTSTADIDDSKIDNIKTN